MLSEANYKSMEILEAQRDPQSRYVNESITGSSRTETESQELRYLKRVEPDSIIDKMGGFGRYQVLLLIITTLLRNFGTLPIYLFALSTHEMKLECRTSPLDVFRECSVQAICDRRQYNYEYLDYRPIETEPGFFFNWWL
jgi:hypothetical protein